eukprot:TRINITY_DN5510_c0_g1_i1.p1 TRINITY_DN5510_c0_g1~~TRINITY_DN5510_c0_g1_i1.p1  ORF type:complete len:192 (+),score=37.77 TRINITY_DN5510_c0_g1_i1:47-577(+)
MTNNNTINPNNNSFTSTHQQNKINTQRNIPHSHISHSQSQQSRPWTTNVNLSAKPSQFSYPQTTSTSTALTRSHTPSYPYQYTTGMSPQSTAPVNPSSSPSSSSSSPSQNMQVGEFDNQSTSWSGLAFLAVGAIGLIYAGKVNEIQQLYCTQSYPCPTLLTLMLLSGIHHAVVHNC